MHSCLPTILSDLIPYFILGIFHILWLPKIGFDVIVFIFPFLCPTINRRVTFFSKVVPFSGEAGFSVILVVVSVVIYFIAVHSTT